MKIYTITLNPAYDVHAYAESFVPYHENLARVLSRDAGGKGVNISRALHEAGVANTAVIVLGTENGGEFQQALVGLDCLYLEKQGRIRENLTLHTPDGRETRISFSGFAVDASVLQEVAGAMDVDADTVITFTGRVPRGISLDAVKAFLSEMQSKGAKIVLDSKSFGLEDIYELKPWLIKPNQEEISEYFGCEIQNIWEAAKKVQMFAENGVTNTMVSLGRQGALLLTGGKQYLASPPEIQPMSTIGAGDSSIAGFLAATVAGEKPENCLKTAVAFGTAACLTGGSQPPKMEDVQKIREQITLVK